MSELAEMIARVAQPGRVDWIGLRGERRGEVEVVPSVLCGEDGLVGDHGRAGKRAVTLIQAEHLGAIGAYLGRGAIAPDVLRRNLVVSGINLASLKGRQVQVGDALLELTVICAPCSRMEEALGHGGYAAVRGHGGWCAKVVRAGRIQVGDVVQVADEGAQSG